MLICLVTVDIDNWIKCRMRLTFCLWGVKCSWCWTQFAVQDGYLCLPPGWLDGYICSSWRAVIPCKQDLLIWLRLCVVLFLCFSGIRGLGQCSPPSPQLLCQSHELFCLGAGSAGAGTRASGVGDGLWYIWIWARLSFLYFPKLIAHMLLWDSADPFCSYWTDTGVSPSHTQSVVLLPESVHLCQIKYWACAQVCCIL